ncbi:MAG: class I SAM-dependent methyltransferase [Methanosarcinales archaeon]|nr:class I SAM-dependent methyltransferase [Methanosarcinales archaeon]
MNQTFSHIMAWEEEHRRGIWKGPYSLDYFHQYAPPSGTILDIGCGIGRYAIPLVMQGYNVLGIDVSLVALGELDVAKRRRNIKMDLVAADTCNLPFQDNIFKGMVCFGVLQHLLEVERRVVMDEFNRILVPGGILIMEVLGREDMRIGGYEVEPFTYRRDTGSVYHYFNISELFGLLKDFDVLNVKEEKIIKNLGGSKRLRHTIYAAAKVTERDK